MPPACPTSLPKKRNCPECWSSLPNLLQPSWRHLCRHLDRHVPPPSLVKRSFEPLQASGSLWPLVLTSDHSLGPSALSSLAPSECRPCVPCRSWTSSLSYDVLSGTPSDSPAHSPDWVTLTKCWHLQSPTAHYSLPPDLRFSDLNSLQIIAMVQWCFCVEQLKINPTFLNPVETSCGLKINIVFLTLLDELVELHFLMPAALLVMHATLADTLSAKTAKPKRSWGWGVGTPNHAPTLHFQKVRGFS